MDEKVMSNEQKVTSKEQNVRSNKQKLTSNERRTSLRLFLSQMFDTSLVLKVEV